MPLGFTGGTSPAPGCLMLCTLRAVGSTPHPRGFRGEVGEDPLFHLCGQLFLLLLVRSSHIFPCRHLTSSEENTKLCVLTEVMSASSRPNGAPQNPLCFPSSLCLLKRERSEVLCWVSCPRMSCGRQKHSLLAVGDPVLH